MVSIKNSVYIIIATLFLSSCVDVLPIPVDEEDKRFVIECELVVGQDIKANVSVSSSINGVLPTSGLDKDSINMTISEGTLDYGVDFKYNGRDKNYRIDKETLSLKIGQVYKLKEKQSSFITQNNDPSLVIPSAMQIKDFVVDSISYSFATNGEIITWIDCTIKIDKPTKLPAYFYLVPTTSKNKTWEVIEFIDYQAAYKRLVHRDGFLIDYSRIGQDEFHLKLAAKDNVAQEKILFNFSNVTEPFYQYNKYKSDALTGGGLSVTPTIAGGFNIMNDKAIGTFSAMTPSSFEFDLK